MWSVNIKTGAKMTVSVKELQNLEKLKFESSVVFIMLSNIIEAKSQQFLSFEGATEAIAAFEDAKKRLGKIYIVLRPDEGREMIEELKQVERFSDLSFLLRGIKIAEENKQLFLVQTDRPPLIESLIALNKFW